MRARTRLRRLTDTIGALPIDPEILRAAFDTFVKTGVLPEDDDLGRAVFRLIRDGSTPQQRHMDDAARIRRFVERGRFTDDEHSDPVRDELISEAFIQPTGTVETMAREASRSLLRMLVNAGKDLRRRVFPEGRPPKTCWSLALTVLGFPAALMRPEDQEEGDALCAEAYEYCREQFEKDPTFNERVERALERLDLAGEVTEDLVVRRAVELLVEVDAMVKRRGSDE